MVRSILLSAGILMVCIACHDTVQEQLTVTSTKLEVLAFSSGELDPAFSPFVKEYSLSSINSLSDITVITKRFSNYATVKLNSNVISGETVTIRFTKGKDILITVTFRDSSEVYRVSWLPPNFPALTINKSASSSLGYIYFAQLNSGLPYSYAAMIDDAGIPVFYKKINSTLVADFKKQLTEKGKTRYTYQVNDPAVVGVLGGFRGETVILDERFNELTTVKSLTSSTGESEPPENHDFIWIDDNHYITTSYVLRRQVDLTAYGGSDRVDLVELLLQEVKDNKVLLEWNSKDFPEFLLNSDDIYKSQYSGVGPVDYFHFNSVCIDPADGNLILSARHINQVFKINRTTGQIMWRFGGKSDEFKLSDNLKFSHQHDASRLQNGNILLVDNGNTKTPQQTRILEFQLNENLRTATLVWQYQETGRFSSFAGSAQRLSNGNTFIGWGGAPGGTSQPDKSDITEVDPQGNVVFDLSFKNQPIDQFSYRAFRFR